MEKQFNVDFQCSYKLSTVITMILFKRDSI